MTTIERRRFLIYHHLVDSAISTPRKKRRSPNYAKVSNSMTWHESSQRTRPGKVCTVLLRRTRSTEICIGSCIPQLPQSDQQADRGGTICYQNHQADPWAGKPEAVCTETSKKWLTSWSRAQQPIPNVSLSLSHSLQKTVQSITISTCTQKDLIWKERSTNPSRACK